MPHVVAVPKKILRVSQVAVAPSTPESHENVARCLSDDVVKPVGSRKGNHAGNGDEVKHGPQASEDLGPQDRFGLQQAYNDIDDAPALLPLALRGSEVDLLLGISKSTRYNWHDKDSVHYDPDFPLPIKLTDKITRYLRTEIEAWLMSRPRLHDAKTEPRKSAKVEKER